MTKPRTTRARVTEYLIQVKETRGWHTVSSERSQARAIAVAQREDPGRPIRVYRNGKTYYQRTGPSITREHREPLVIEARRAIRSRRH